MNYRKHSEIVLSSPSKLFVMIGEHPNSIQEGAFVVRNGAKYRVSQDVMQDVPASWHSGGTSLNFADGHSEIKVWQDERTKPRFRPDWGQHFYEAPIVAPGNVDLAWLRKRSAGIARPR